MSKSALITMTLIISTVTTNMIAIPRVYSQTKSVSNMTSMTSKASQSANLVTEAATISNNWHEVKGNSVIGNHSFTIRDPECKKTNALEYLDKPETFFQPCISTNDLNPSTYDPIEYLKVPELDSGLSVNLSNF